MKRVGGLLFFISFVFSMNSFEPCAALGHQLVINEIMFSSTHDWVEVYCIDDGNSGQGMQINGFSVDDLDEGKDKIIGTCTIKTGEFLLLHYGIEGQDENYGKQINFFTPNKSITSTSDQIVLYDSSGEKIDAVCWANSTPPQSEIADIGTLIANNRWQGTAIDSIIVQTGQSIARNLLSDTDTGDDWYAASVPTPGLSNDLISQMVNPPQIKVINILNKIFDPQEGKQVTIIYSLSKAAEVSLRIYDIRGRLIKRLVEQEYQISREDNRIFWDGRDNEGAILPVGVYICYLEAVGDDGSSSDKIPLILAKR